MRTPSALLAVVLTLLILPPPPAHAQQGGAPAAVIAGRVIEAATGQPLLGVVVTLEGTRASAVTDSAGRYRLPAAPPGPQVLRAQRIGYAPTRVNVVVPATGTLERDLALARRALELQGVQVTADAAGRARGELGTASVIEREAIRNQMASSLAGVLELIPGVPLQAPGLGGVQQIALRSVPVSGGGGGGQSAQNLAAFGTAIIIDGVPLSNNANLQSLGSRGEVSFSSAAGGGVDLRRIPATTIERVEVIRGVPSARFGDLTQGAIVVDTRAGPVEPDLSVRLDAATTELSLVGGRRFGARQTGTLSSNLARTRAGSTSDDQSTRFAAQLAHRVTFGGEAGDLAASDGAADARFVLDTRADFYRLEDDRPEVATFPGRELRSRDAAFRLVERLRWQPEGDARLEWTVSYERGQQRNFSRANRIRGAMPVTTRTEPGRQVGRYLGGEYNAALQVDGDPSLFYSRAEYQMPASLGGFAHDLRLGAELRREGNDGRGYQFDIEFPPQVTFNGVRGFDRPRTFDVVPALATSALYLDDRLRRTLPGGMLLDLQAGLRADLLHEEGSWLSGARDLVLQPRLNAELAPTGWLRLRAGAGRLAKTPSLGDLYPSPDYYDVINVNFFANDPAERLAVLTTFVLDPTNPDLGYTVSDRVEGGFEVRLGRGGSNLSVTAFADRVTNAVGVRPEATFITREHFDLENTAPGSGRPPTIVEPAASVDEVPVLISRPAHNTALRGSGVELTADFQEIPALRTRLAFQGAFVRSRVATDGLEFGNDFGQFQLSDRQARAPYYQSIVQTGERALLTTRVIHQQPQIGLVITGTVQHTLHETVRNEGAADTLAFAGYVNRDGTLVPVPLAERGDPQYDDLRIPRLAILLNPQDTPADWLFSVQVMKTLPRDGRLSFYAFNAFDRPGRFAGPSSRPRRYSPNRFGLEVTIPVEGLIP
jgi:hypothetical protein